ncbi:DUF421 domain-containing protein [Paenibacillaceae bacterium]|nr:DUF421 domain-containing protein [Paenibacillaceae bacterium]
MSSTDRLEEALILQELALVLTRTLLIYVVVFLVMRLMGKREIGKLSIFDFVISVMIAEIAVIVIEDTDRSMLHGIVPMVGLLVIQVGMAYLAMKSRTIRLLFDGKPTVIIARGRLLPDALRKQRYNLDDMMLQLRENGIASIAEVDFAILETSGKLSVIPKEKGDVNSSSTLDLNSIMEKTKVPADFRFENLPIPLIMNGKVQDENLQKLNQNRFWLKSKLQQQQIDHFKDVFLCTLDHRGQIYIARNSATTPH